MEKPKLRIIYQLEKGRRGGLKREKFENYIVGFKFNTEKERDEFKEFVKKCYYDDCCENTKRIYDPETGNIDKVPEIEFYRAELKKAGIKFHPSTGLEKLKEKYDQFLQDTN